MVLVELVLELVADLLEFVLAELVLAPVVEEQVVHKIFEKDSSPVQFAQDLFHQLLGAYCRTSIVLERFWH